METLRYPDITAHHLIDATAVEMAHEVYETLCLSSNTIYKGIANRRDFIKTCAPTLRRAARTILAKMLADPDTSEGQKALIHEALCLDADLPQQGTSMVKRGTSQ